LRKKAMGIDYWGIGLLVLGMGSLQIMLDKGQEEDWFSSHFIVVLTLLAAIGLTGLIFRELNTDHPIIDLSVFKYRSYAIGTFLMTAIGFVLYGSTVLLPLLMQELLGYTATHAGVTNLPRGFASFLFMPLIGILTGKVDSRKLLGVGLLVSALAMFQLSRLTLDVGFWNFWWPLAMQGAALGLVFVPLTTVTNGPIPRERMGNATSIFNLMRNVGASIGISMVETLQFRRLQTHINVLGKHVNAENPLAMRTIAGMRGLFMAQGKDSATATRQAHAALWGSVQQQAAMLSYNDVFLFLAIMFVAMFPLIFLMSRPRKAGSATMAH
jgi:MFS transporter, DHA2 family, multidrug resistance protein